jgi:GNAT superfamily N-acetyltransferase
MSVKLEEFSDEYAVAVLELVHSILTEEFGFSASTAEQPDLFDVPRHYGAGASNFWVVIDKDQPIGTIGFVDLGAGHGLLRKMFVRSDHRGSDVAGLLLERVLSWAMNHDFSAIYLGTNSKFRAARRFYEKNGFVPVSADSLPGSVPRLDLRDQFYFRPLA